MTIQVHETDESRSLNDGYEANQKSLELQFLCWDDAKPPPDCSPLDMELAVATTLASAPYGDPIYGLRLQTISLKELTKFCSIATVRYGIFEPPKLNQLKWGLTTAGDTEQISHSLATVASYPATGEPYANHGLAINVTEHGIQGTKRGFGKLKFWVTAFLDPTGWNAAAWLALTEMCYSWNLSSWHGWPAKHVLFEYCECPEVVFDPTTGNAAADLVPVKFYFQARAPEAVDKGNGISFTKDPWDFTWDETKLIVSGVRKAHQIRQTNREQLYLGSDFGLLGLGT